jgi:hypothetical protein
MSVLKNGTNAMLWCLGLKQTRRKTMSREQRQQMIEQFEEEILRLKWIALYEYAERVRNGDKQENNS